MSYTSFIAERYFTSSRRKGFLSFISYIAIIGVALGVAALIIALAVLGGFEGELKEKVIGFTSHVQVTSYHNQPLTNSSSNIALIEKCSPLIKAVQPFVAREALIRSGENIDGVLLKGLDPARDASRVREYIVSGNYDVSRAPGGLANIVLGRKLADKLETSVGDKVTVVGTANTSERGQMRAMQFRVVGVYESGMAEYDDVFAFTSLKDAQILFQFGEAVSGYDVLVTDLDSAEIAAERIRDVLGFPH
jgi:lipoprotein-releasing system permease protein